MRSLSPAGALALAGALACASCALDELGIVTGGSDGEGPRDVTPVDGPRPAHDASVDHEAPKDGGGSPIEGGAPDAHSDVSKGGMDSAPPPDAEEDSSGTDSPSSMTYTCGSVTTTDCAAGCPGKPVSCLYCSLVFGNAGFCGLEGRDCVFDNPPIGRGPCACGSTSGCLSEDQICIGFQCRSCGEQASSGKTCKGGGKCDEKTATCK
jgi:hypothetical protein